MLTKQDQSVHGYRERYNRILYQLFHPIDPVKFSQPLVKKEGVSKLLKPFPISEENRKVLYDLYLHQESSNENSVARRWTLFRLLSRITLLLEDPNGFPKEMTERTFRKMASANSKEEMEHGRKMAQSLALKARSTITWNRTTENFHLRALKQLMRFMNGGDTTPYCVAWLRFKTKKADAGEDFSKRPKKVEREDLYNESEIQTMLDHAGHSMIRCAIAILWEGLRAGELLSLKKSSITQENGLLKISVSGKTGDRTVLCSTGSRYVREWLSLHPNQKTDDWLFVITSNKNKAKRYSYDAMNHEIHRLKKRAKITKRGNLHAFRHSRVVDMLIKGYSPEIIRKIMGWTSLDMLQTYGHLVDEDVHKEVINREFQGKIIPKPSILAPTTCMICLQENEPKADICKKCGNALNDHGLTIVREKFDMEKMRAEITAQIMQSLLENGVSIHAPGKEIRVAIEKAQKKN